MNFIYNSFKTIFWLYKTLCSEVTYVFQIINTFYNTFILSQKQNNHRWLKNGLQGQGPFIKWIETLDPYIFLIYLKTKVTLTLYRQNIQTLNNF